MPQEEICARLSASFMQVAVCSHEQDYLQSAVRREFRLLLTLMNIISDVLSVPW